MSTSKIKEYTYQEAIELIEEGYIMEYYNINLKKWDLFDLKNGRDNSDLWKNYCNEKGIVFRKKGIIRPEFEAGQELNMRGTIIAFEMDYSIEFFNTLTEEWQLVKSIDDICKELTDYRVSTIGVQKKK